jgi:hypothetical protein
MTKFKFKRNTWTNHEPPPSYRISAPAVGGIGPTDSNMAGTARPGWPLAVQAVRASSSAWVGDTGQPAGATDPLVGSSDPHWNQPKVGSLYLTLDHITSVFSLPFDHQHSNSSLQHTVHNHISISHVSFLSPSQYYYFILNHFRI